MDSHSYQVVRRHSYQYISHVTMVTNTVVIPHPETRKSASQTRRKFAFQEEIFGVKEEIFEMLTPDFFEENFEGIF